MNLYINTRLIDRHLYTVNTVLRMRYFHLNLQKKSEIFTQFSGVEVNRSCREKRIKKGDCLCNFFF